VDDSYGDGLCCDYGNGHIKLSVDRSEVLYATNFTTFYTQTFGDVLVPVDGTKPPPSPYEELTFKLVTDYFPWETSMLLTNMNTGEEYWGDLEFYEEETLYTQTLDVDPAHC